METIEIEVDGAVAKAWENCDPVVRKVYEEKIIGVLKELQVIFSEEES